MAHLILYFSRTILFSTSERKPQNPSLSGLKKVKNLFHAKHGINFKMELPQAVELTPWTRKE